MIDQGIKGTKNWGDATSNIDHLKNRTVFTDDYEAESIVNKRKDSAIYIIIIEPKLADESETRGNYSE